VFYLNVAYVLQWFSSVFYVFLQVFHMHVSTVLSDFRHMLQILHLDVLKSRLGVASPSSLSTTGASWASAAPSRRHGPRVDARNDAANGIELNLFDMFFQRRPKTPKAETQVPEAHHSYLYQKFKT
jgi:hypothetical protein